MTAHAGDTPESTGRPWTVHYTPGTTQDLDYGTTTLIDQFDDAVSSYSSRPATEFFGRLTTYADLGRRVRRAAEGLRRLGVDRGDRVAVLLPNCPQGVAVFYAALRIGAIVVEHNPLYTADELEGPFADHGAKVVVTWNVVAPVVRDLADRPGTAIEHIISVDLLDELPAAKRLALKHLPVPSLRASRDKLSRPAPGTLDWADLETGAELDFSYPRPAAEDPALILYTSGTTGTPKGAVLTHANLVANAKMGRAWVPELTPGEEKFLASLPMFHAYGVTLCVVFGIAEGARLQLVPTPDMDLIMPILKKELPTFIPAVPPIYTKILEEAEKRKIPLHGIRHSLSGAMSLPAELIERWESATGGLLVEGYGMTETSPITVGNPMSTARRAGSIGVPFPDTDIRVADKDDPSVDAPAGEPGELLVKGPQVFPGYWRNEKATAETFHDGWIRTGDVVVQDSDGFLHVVDRIKEMIVTGGFNVYPSEVEAVLRTAPGVADCAVVGRPSSDGGEKVIAAVVPEPGATLDPDALRAHCKGSLAGYKVPREFVELDELPTNPMGKVLRKRVAQQINP
ncbi:MULTISPECIES: long-chain-fatty-acid--CoA ligase [Dietzia]|jgi:long-chain acyl-CoA synthetase|uniref:Long-chain-fatty-acid--CoA ligase n=1 Tax=Dietzia maris TaxID=37915 RepID=A0ABT8GZS6_9ACTN|nr:MULTISPECIES: long-chain-fatty-acid--CoA ligase [Dietzia]HBD21953.1 long-chain fatty acid--CoA ligase [Dietzia sp.]MBB0997973.1 AMP-binding protein [Dietzia maris]MBB1018457.1 AMP-binding protein [Dietzia sp. DQ11-71]MCZ4540871.1 long-chain-fatty-acid--CoA ligase [Dietzia maris]MDJ0423998.1 long-chain-fatty-acid--CoA ligase [Dietzia kunjamensis]